MKKFFTFMVMLLSVIGAQAADTELLNLDFSESTYAGKDFPSDGSQLGIVYSKGSGASVSEQGVVTYQTGGNMSSSRNFCVIINGVNKTVSIKFILSEKGQKIRYNIAEASEYAASVASSKIADLTAGEDGTVTATYNMTGEGSDICLYFGQGSSDYTSGLKGIVVTTPSGTVTKAFTDLYIDGTKMSVDDWNVLDSQGSIEVTTAFDHLPNVKYVVTTTTTEGESTEEVDDEYTAEVVEDGENYKASFTVEGETYSVIFTNVTIAEELVVTDETTVVLTKDNITSYAYLATSTENWATGKTYGGYSGDFYNMSNSDRNITIKVSGAIYIEVFVQNSNAGRTYTVNDESITHNGGGVESSGLISITSAEGTVVTIAGGGKSVYPVYVKFYTQAPPVSVTIAEGGYATLTSAFALDFSNADAQAFIATGFNTAGDAVILKEVKKVPANTGIIVKGTASSTVEIPLLDGDADDVTGNMMEGSATEAITLTAGQGYILAKDGLFYECAAGSLPKGKAYLAVAASASMVEAKLGLVIEGEGVATAIQAVENQQNDNAVYNLQGVRMKNASQKGIYIINGKKVVK